jgi:hypothetical protein
MKELSWACIPLLLSHTLPSNQHMLSLSSLLLPPCSRGGRAGCESLPHYAFHIGEKRMLLPAILPLILHYIAFPSPISFCIYLSILLRDREKKINK